jgi:hypothetical protein
MITMDTWATLATTITSEFMRNIIMSRANPSEALKVLPIYDESEHDLAEYDRQFMISRVPD